MTYQTPLNGRTLFSKVKQLQPGCILTLETHRLKEYVINKYWTPEQNIDKSLTFSKASAHFGDVLKDSVERHLLSHVPVAAYLSAGFDSSSVASSFRFEENRLHAYTGWFEDQGNWYDESKIALEAVENFKGLHNPVRINGNDFENYFDELINALDEPKMGMMPSLSTLLPRKLQKKFKVILTGHGGDELFSELSSF